MKTRQLILPALAVIAGATITLMAAPKKNVIDEVAWVVGDEAIFRSDVEDMYAQMRSEGAPVAGDPYCTIPEELAVEKLFLHQAQIDTIEAPESQVLSQVDRRLNFFIANLGSKEKVEQYFRKPLPQLREQLIDITRNGYIVEQVKANLTKDVKGTPRDVRRYFESLPDDSIPYVPLTVEAQIITLNPLVPRQEVEDVKARLRDYADRVNRGEADFATLAIMNSEDRGSALQGGELGFHGKADFVPEFSNVAFNLTDPKKVSRIVETEFGYHIIQLIEKRGDQANVRHILLRPHVSDADLQLAVERLDSLGRDIRAEKFTFEQAAGVVSQDKDTRNNRGVMVNQQTGSTRFEMQQLPPEVAQRIEKMQPGEVSEAFIMKDERKNRDVACIVKLTARVDGHKASMLEDYNLLKGMYEAHETEQILRDWVEKKIRETHVRIEEGWYPCEFKYEGWIK
ncbi:MAG: peptidylprolyl isomerase [Muribaculaceae bacterium]|nr:peptidylprolyl isomerase [Muribaculaceae bacterium]MDE5956688.1 peptidylprolyl isomerase [Muribaculaceae bacterium]